MNELDMLRTARPQDTYPAELRDAARGRLLAAAAEPPARGATRALRGRRRPSWHWQVGIAACLAIGVAIAVAGARLGSGARSATAAGSARASGSTTAILQLASQAAAENTPPPGTRWVVWESRFSSNASSARTCVVAAKSSSALAFLKPVGPLGSCPAQPPASIPGLRGAKPVVVGAQAGYPDPAGLPDEPGPLLSAVYRWCAADWAKNADSLPGQPAPPPTRADLQSSAFDTLGLMLSSGVTSPAPAVQLRALALIPGTRLITGAHNAAGRPGIAVAITGNPAQVGFAMDEIIFDARTYQDIGGVLVQPRAGGGTVTLSTTMQWQAYYDANGHRL